MLFNSFPFLLVFLPLALLLHWGVERFAPQWRLVLLAALSFAFYGYWDWRFVPLMALSIGLNWWMAEAFIKSRPASGTGTDKSEGEGEGKSEGQGQGWIITFAIVVNLAVLAAFKYFNFLAGMAALLYVLNELIVV